MSEAENNNGPLRVALFGQSAFGAAVLAALLDAGHTVTAVFTVVDGPSGRADPIAVAAEEKGVPVHKVRYWRKRLDGGGFAPIQRWLDVHAEARPQFNVMAFVTQLIPTEVCDACPTLCYHPSLLPRHRGPSAINFTLMKGDSRAGLTWFYPDGGYDTGDICVQRQCDVDDDDTVGSLYRRFLFPEGVQALVDMADELHRTGSMPRRKQPDEGSTYDRKWDQRAAARLSLDDAPGRTMHNWVRGNDPVPGSWVQVGDEQIVLYKSHWRGADGPPADGRGAIDVAVDGYGREGGRARVDADGLWLSGSDGEWLVVRQIAVGESREKKTPLEHWGADC